MSKKYLVEWTIDMDAESPREAAQKAWEAMRTVDSTANHFSVLEYDGDGERVEIDLSAEGEDVTL